MIRGLRPAVVALAILVASPSTASPEPGLADQLQARGIRDTRVLDAFRRVDGERLVPFGARDWARADAPSLTGRGRSNGGPYLVARMTELLGVRPEDRVLEIGTGSGYQTAILAELARAVCSVELVPRMAGEARLRLTRFGYRNVHVKQGDGALGWREYGPYDRVVVWTAAPRVPRALIDQLVEGGVLVMPLGAPGQRQALIRGVKRGNKLYAREIADVRLVGTKARGTRNGDTGDAAFRRDDRINPGSLGSDGVIREEPLPPEGPPAPKSERRGTDTRFHLGERIRAVCAPAARGSDRWSANSGSVLAAAGFPTRVRRCAG